MLLNKQKRNNLTNCWTGKKNALHVYANLTMKLVFCSQQVNLLRCKCWCTNRLITTNNGRGLFSRPSNQKIVKIKWRSHLEIEIPCKQSRRNSGHCIILFLIIFQYYRALQHFSHFFLWQHWHHLAAKMFNGIFIFFIQNL